MVLEADAFFAAVDQHITPPMARLGYLRLPAGVAMSESRKFLVSRPWWSRALPWSRRKRRRSEGQEREFTVGYEAADEDVARQLSPDDPATADELSISYYPGTGELDLSSWSELLIGHANWPVAADGVPLGDDEVVRLIAVCGSAVDASNS
jgi:hypothetical protein